MTYRTRIATILVGGVALFTCVGCADGGSSTSHPSASSSGGSERGAPTSAATRPSHTRSATSRAPGSPVATEFNPPGDIPDNQVFVKVARRGVGIRVPEGWARKDVNGAATFTDHYNSVSLVVTPAQHRPTVGSARRLEVPALRTSVPKFALKRVGSGARAGERVIEVDYELDSPANPVTGKVVRDAAERFEFFRSGREAVLTLTGPRNADNVDPWRLVSNSLQWRR